MSEAASNIVDLSCKTADVNMYGCLPCPKCSSKYRWSRDYDGLIICHDCGFTAAL
jgi:ribosomal protein L37AE/L43A